MRNKFRGPSPRPQAHSRPFSRTPSPPPCSATFVRCVVVFFLLSGCSDDPLPERAAAGPTCLPRPHSFARRHHQLPASPYGSRLGAASGAARQRVTPKWHHPGRADFVRQPEHSRETKAAEEQGRRRGNGCSRQFSSWASFLLPFRRPSSNIVWHCSH